MSERLRTVITFDQACEMFREDILPMIVQAYELDGFRDGPARCEAWCNWTDSLCKDGQISDWQYMNWTYPDYL